MLIWFEQYGQFICIFYVDVIHCAAITPSDAKCTKRWVQYGPNYFARGNSYTRASKLTECKQACERDPRCITVDWQSIDRQCWININPNHPHYSTDNEEWIQHGRHYLLVRRCSITAGQCFQLILTFR